MQAACDDTFDPEYSHYPSNTGSTLQIFIPQEKWKIIEPEEREYTRDSHEDTTRQTQRRMYKVLKPGIWTDVFTSIIWDAVKWPCAWSYKGNYVSKNHDAKYWIFIRAKCGCGNKFIASAPNPPPSDPHQSGVTLNVQLFGEKNNHAKSTVQNRPFTGEKRRKLGEDMLDKQLQAKRVRNFMASEILNMQDPYPAHLPSSAVIRQVKSQALKSRRLDNDVLRSIQLLKYSSNSVFKFSIQEIGLDPFFVHICTPNQLQIYNLYCRRSYSRLIIDATGKLVQRIPIPGKGVSGHIFLYLGVVRISGPGEGLIPVVQMLSERHNANAIAYWLSEWLRAGATVPSEVVLDDSAALISATCRVLGGEPSTASYIQKSLRYLEGDDSCKPKCLVRIDVAHFTNMIRKWPEIQKMKRRTQEFYIRVIILVASAQTIQQAKKLLTSIFIIALSETEGVSTSTKRPTPCEVNKKILFDMIAGIDVPEPPVNWVGLHAKQACLVYPA